MKKILTGILVLALVASMAVPAFAETTTGGDSSITVNGTYQAAEAAADVISVDIEWEPMDFTYTAGSKGTWNASTHQYDNPAEGGWAATGGTDPKITLTNHSNVPINANFAFAADVDGLNGSFTKTALVLDSAEETDPSNAPTGETAFSVSGSAIDADKILGTITVTVAKDTNDSNNYISTETELIEAAEKGGSFKLANDLDINDRIISAESDFEIDLNGKSINGSCGFIVRFVTQKISNGTISTSNRGESALWSTGDGKAIVDNCTLTANDYYAVYVSVESTATITDSTLTSLDGWGAAIADGENTVLKFVGSNVINGDVEVEDGGKVIFSGNVTLNGNINKSGENSTVICEAGTYNFDPTDYVDSEKFDITNDDTIWTVTEK